MALNQKRMEGRHFDFNAFSAIRTTNMKGRNQRCTLVPIKIPPIGFDVGRIGL
jgi:hypothetical protein